MDLFWHFFVEFGKRLHFYENEIKTMSKYYNGTSQTEDDTALHGFVWKSRKSYRTKSFEMFLTKRNIRGFTIFMLGEGELCKYICFDERITKQHSYAYMLYDFVCKHLQFCRDLSFHDLMYDFFTSLWGMRAMTVRKRQQIMHQWLSKYKPYCDYVDNFPPLKIKVCVIYEQNNESKECLAYFGNCDILFADEYVVMHICNMLDITCD